MIVTAWQKVATLVVCLACGVRKSASRLQSTPVQNRREAPRIGRTLQGILTQQHVDEPIHVIVGYKDGGSPDPDSIQTHSLKVDNGLKRVNAAGAVVSKEQLELLLLDPNVSYIEEDALVFPASLRETVPWGVHATQGDATEISKQYATELNRNTCNDPSSIKVALIDSGVDWDHPDIPCTSLNETDTNCIGREFELDNSTERWYDPSDSHGTHVFGTFAGSRSNGVGVSGMLSDDHGICFIVCQIFSKSKNARASTVIEAAQWAIEKGATVINMSLSTFMHSLRVFRYKGGSLSGFEGGSDYVYTAEQFFAGIRSSGVISIAASGNGTLELRLTLCIANGIRLTLKPIFRWNRGAKLPRSLPHGDCCKCRDRGSYDC